MINRRRTFEYANTHGYLIKQADTNYQPTRLLKLSYVKFIFINVTWYQMFSQTIFFFFLRFLTFAFSTEENLRRRRKEKKKQKNWNERTRTQTKLSSRWKIFGSIVAQTVKFLCNRTFDSYACSGYVCGMDSRRSTGSISLYRRGVYIGLFAMRVDVSCARGVKWAAWHLQLQPLGLNKGRSLAAFPTQLSPFYRGFHSCFISSVSLHRVHTMRRHLGRVHSSVFSIFFSLLFLATSLFFSLSFFFFFFCSPPADQSQSDGNPSDSSVATHSQIVPASSSNFYDHGGVARTWSHSQIGSFRFRSYYSSRSFLFDRFIRVWIGKRFW